MSDSAAQSTPKHLWVVGILSLLWNLMGVVDNVMTLTKNEAYMKEFTDAQKEYFYGLPSYSIGFWIVATWASLFGSIFLLMRKSWAFPALFLSFVCMAANTVYCYGFTNGYELMGGVGPLLFSVAIFIISFALFVYAKRMTTAGVLS